MTDTVHSVAISAGRSGISPAQEAALVRLLKLWSPSRLIHGAAPGGDRQADAVARELGIRREMHPCNREQYIWAFDHRGTWDAAVVYPIRPPLIRNAAMMQLGTYAVGMPAPDSRGTWHAIRDRRRFRLPLVVVMPDGSETWEHWDAASPHYAPREATTEAT